MSAERKLPTITDALKTWSDSALREQWRDLMSDLSPSRSEMIADLVDYDWFENQEQEIIAEAFGPQKVPDRMLSKGVCECGHLLSDHLHVQNSVEERKGVWRQVVRVRGCEVRNRNFNPCACCEYHEDFGGEWVGNEDSRVGFL